MKQKVYLETTVVSYLTAWPSRQVVQAAHQEITRDWWEGRHRFDLYISQAVVEEIARGDVQAATSRLEAVQGIQVLTTSLAATELARRFLRAAVLPEKAFFDALHIALAVVHGMDYLLTWNCAHIANAAIRGKIERVCWQAGFTAPAICTPEELMEESSDAPRFDR